MRSFLFLILLFVFVDAQSQCPSIDWGIVKDNLCMYEELIITNNSTNGETYSWDFCTGDLMLNPTAGITKVISESVTPVGIDILFDSGTWYGFLTSKDNNKLFRLDFGESLDNDPSIIDLGNVGDLLNRPQTIKIVKNYNSWYGFIQNSGTNELVRIEFGNKLSNTPINSAIILSSSGAVNNGFDVAFDGTNWVIVLGKLNKLTLINFGNSLSNLPQTSDIIVSGSIPGANNISDISLIKNEGLWYGYVTSYNSKSIHKLDFGHSLFTLPTITQMASSFLGSDLPYGVELQHEDTVVIGYVVTLSGNLYRLIINDLSEDLSGTQIGKLAVLSNTLKIAMAKNLSRWSAFSINYSSKQLYRISFPDNCTASISTSDENTPQGVSYFSAGEKSIELIVGSNSGCTERTTEKVFVINSTAPNTSFSTDNTCVDNQNNFSASSSDNTSITSWNWDFGDGSAMASGQNVSHQYLDIGNYEVKLSIDAANGCSNTSSKNISIYNPPLVGFSYNTGVICSNNPISFTNNTIFSGPDSLLSFLWKFNNEASTNQQNPSYTFTTGGDKNITLSASIPGCVSESSKVVNIGEGPIVGFNFFGTCQYEDFSFVNSTIGADITGYKWDFGDGYFSTLTSPVHKYASGGDYSIKLTASNAIGCNTSIQKIVPVRHVPKLNFTNDLACSDNMVTLFDKSTVQDANISSWSWQLENRAINYNKSRTGPSPSFLLSGHGEYTGTLIGQSNYGCADTLSRIITVNQSPKVDFTITNTCYGDSTNFRSQVQLPGGTTLENTEWIIENKSYTTEEVNYRFFNPGSYPVTLYARASNLCPGNTLKSIRINPLPSVNFQLSSQCEEQDVLFTSTVSSPADPVSSYLWTIDNKSLSNKPEFTYQFKKDGNSDIKLQVVSANNCVNSLQKNLPIYPRPVSKFDATPSIGPTPLLVQFTDRSQGANLVTYDFSTSNTDISTDRNPTYTYTTLVKDIAHQFVSNNYGCRDTSSKSIDVIVPLFDLAIESVKAKISNANIQFVILLRNDGNIIINNPELSIDISGLVKMRQRVECTLAPGGTYEYFTDFQIINNGSTIEYACFSTDMTYGIYTDADDTDNSQCTNLENSFIVTDPYPNPSKTRAELDIILPEIDDVILKMVDDRGSVLLSKDYLNMPSGLNTITIDLAPFRQGLYMLSLKYKNASVTKKLMIL